MLVMRMSRRGTKKRPFYHIVVADSRFPRDGRYIEKIGTYNPMLTNDNPQRLTLNAERAKHWLSQGAQPSDRVGRFLHLKELGPKPTWNETPQKSAPKAKAQERMKAEEEAKLAAAEAAKQAAEDAKKAAEAPAEAPAEAAAEPAAEAAPVAEEVPVEAPAEAPAEEKQA
ncbi:MAG: 30S ribosomal protein S16 [Alphaproteobacteria bacterium]|nr:30S ribosomal protein S16 [Alphaproteobacteria bacterium]